MYILNFKKFKILTNTIQKIIGTFTYCGEHLYVLYIQ